MTTKPSPGTLDKVHWTFDTVAQMKADTRLRVGDAVETRGYLAPGDGGGARYSIAVSATVVDTYVDHALANGLKAVLDHDATFHAEWAGAVNGVECSAQLNAAWRHIRDWKTSQPNNPDILFCHGSTGTIANMVSIRSATNGRITGVNLDFSNSDLTAVAGGNLTSDRPMLNISIRGDARLGYLDGGKFAAGYTLSACAGSRVHSPRAERFKGFGLRVTGAAGSLVVNTPFLNEYAQSDPEFNTQSNFTARGIDCRDGDWTCIGANVKWCKTPVYIADNVVGVHFLEPHLVNGNPNYQAGSEPLVLLGMGASNMLGHSAATDGDHTISSGVYVWNGTASTEGTGFIPAAFGTAPFNIASPPHANSLLIHAANSLKASTGRDVYLIIVAMGGRKIEAFISPQTLAANGWSYGTDLTPFMYPQILNACLAVPGRNSPFPDLILWQQGHANQADSAAVYAAKLRALIDDLRVEGVLWEGQTRMTFGQLVPDDSYLTTHASALATVAADSALFKVVSTSGLTDVGDDLHFTGASLVTLGQRHAAAFTFPSAGAGAPAFAESVLIENRATRTNHFSGAYFDNGLILDYYGTLNIRGGHYVKNNRVTLAHPYIRVFARSANQDAAPGFSVTDLGGKCSIGFVANGSFTWSGDWASIAPQYTNMDDDNNSAQARKTEYNLYSASPAKVEHNYKPTGKIRKEWQVGPETLVENYDATNKTYEIVGTVKGTVLTSGSMTVANLPSASTAGAGARTMVNNANSTTFNSIVAGGGSNVVPVYSDGTNWRIG